MASTHKHIRSSTASKRPTTAIADGQIALNTNATSPGLFFKDSTGASIIKVGPVHVGTTAPNATPAAGGSSGNSTGEVWLDTSLTPVGVKIWNGSAWVNATPVGSTTVQGLLELATDVETQTGSDTARAVTPAGLQSKVSDSTSTTSSTTIASSTAVKAAYDLANAALPKAGGTVTGALEIGSAGSLVFEGATADDFETTLGVVDPTADRSILLPDVNGTVITTGDTGTVTSGMIADGTIVNADISGSAEIAVSKLADGAARQVLQTDAAGTGVEWTDSVALPGSATATSFSPTGSSVPTNGFYLPTTNNVAISTSGTQRATIDANGRLLVGTSSSRVIVGTAQPRLQIEGLTFDTASASITRNSDDSGGPSFRLMKARGTANGSTTLVADDDILGSIIFVGTDGTAGIQAASISAEVDGTPGANDMPGRLVFSTTADGASSSTERMRIPSDGQISVFGGGNNFITRNSNSAGTTFALLIGQHSASSTITGTTSIHIATNGNVRNTNNSYTGLSDAKLKENIVDATSQWDDIKDIRVRKYNFKAETNHETYTQIGVIAQEIELVSPGLVTDYPDLDENGNDLGTVTKSVNYSVLYMKAVKALQEVMERIETLEANNADLVARVTALEAQ